MRVKICGLMRLCDIRVAIDSGADALGFVVASPTSHRNLSTVAAQNLMKTIPIFTSKVAVTSSQDSRILHRMCARLKPDAVQLHKPTKETIRTIRKTQPHVELIVAMPVRSQASIGEAKKASRYSDAVLADSLGSDGMGGTGRTHDWNLAAKIREGIFPHPLILAGGLTPTNVRAAIEKVQPFAVDVSSGVEARTGVKDPKKIRNFIRNAKETKV